MTLDQMNTKIGSQSNGLSLIQLNLDHDLKNSFFRTTTLDDIYKHYAMTTPGTPHHPVNNVQKNMGMSSRQDYQYEDEYRDEYEEGDVTGYVMQSGGNINANNNVVS